MTATTRRVIPAMVVPARRITMTDLRTVAHLASPHACAVPVEAVRGWPGSVFALVDRT